MSLKKVGKDMKRKALKLALPVMLLIGVEPHCHQAKKRKYLKTKKRTQFS